MTSIGTYHAWFVTSILRPIFAEHTTRCCFFHPTSVSVSSRQVVYDSHAPVSEKQGGCSLKDAAPDHHGYLPWVKWSCLLLQIVLQDAWSEVTKVYPPPKLKIFVDDIKGAGRYCRERFEVNKKESLRRKSSGCRLPKEGKKAEAR